MTASGNVSSYKISTYRNAAFGIRRADFDLCTASPQQIKSIKGIGDSLRSTIVAVCQKDEFPEYADFMQTIPPGVVEMSQINGLGPKKINTLWRAYQIDSLDKLQKVIDNGNLEKIKGYGKTTVQKIKKNLLWLQQNRNKNLYATVADLATEILSYFQNLYPEATFNLMGDIPRRSNVVSSIDLIGTIELQVAADEISLLDKITKLHEDYLELDFEGARVHLFYTEKKPEEVAHKITYTLGDTLITDGRPAYQVEPYYQDLTPQSQNLIQYEDIKALIHCHSTYSDGANTIEEMAQKCIELGLEYMVLSDHSKSAFYADGLSEERIQQQAEEVAKLNQKLKPFYIFRSIECDILTDGSLDYDNQTLDTLDLVIASVHSGLDMDIDTATQRLITAIEHPSTTILGHMTGRLLLKREGYPVAIKKIADACLEHNVAIEINANPRRLDVDAYYLPYLLERGIKVSINPDAHSTTGIEDLKWGVIAAQKGGVQKTDNLSSLTLIDFKKYLDTA